MPRLQNFVLELVNAPGSAAAWALAGSPQGYRPFAGPFATGDVVYVCATDGQQSQWGLAQLTTGTPNVLTWTEIRGYNSATAGPPSFAGVVQIYAERGAEYQVLQADVGWAVIGQNTAPSGLGAINFDLPAAYARFRLEWQGVTPAASAALYARFSFDGGSTFRSGATDYHASGMVCAGSAIAAAENDNFYIPFTGVISTPAFGWAEFQPDGDQTGLYQGRGRAGANTAFHSGAFLCTAGLSPATQIALGWAGANFAGGGRVRLLGARA